MRNVVMPITSPQRFYILEFLILGETADITITSVADRSGGGGHLQSASTLELQGATLPRERA